MPDLLFELRCEELPPKDVRAAAGAIEAALRSGLAAAGLAPEATSAAWTPRRITLFATGVPARSADREERVKGPRASAAFDAAGAPTKAAEGFARKCGVTVSDLQRDGDFTVAVVRTPGRSASDVLAEELPALPGKAGWRKTMRWGGPLPFARPIRGVVALLGDEVVPCTVAGLEAGRETRGHRFLAPAALTLTSASRGDYVEALRAARVLVDPEERRAAVLAAARGAWPDTQPREELLEEVVNLVEWPSALLGNYAARYLELPPRLLVTVMEHHQRFFPARDASGALAPHFVAIRDREADTVEVSRRGFERVLVPRLQDATFFFAEDRKKPLEDRLARLETVIYHRKLGTVREKADRLSRLAGVLAAGIGLPEQRQTQAARAGLLAKCDLVTLLVGEFPELQGHVGSVYARLDGEPAEVCEALDAQYRHDFGAQEELGGVAVALLLAENLDVLCQFGAKVGLPSGSTDPFGVRRAAITLIEVSELWAPKLGLAAAVRAADGTPEVLAYLDARLRHRAQAAGARPDHIDAVQSYGSALAFRARIEDLRALSESPDFDRLLEVAERCRNITKKSDAPSADVRPDLLTEPAERALWEAWEPLRGLATQASGIGRAEVERIAATLAAPLHRFFEEVFVNAEDAAVRTNRHALLREIDAALLGFADLCRVVRRGA